VTGQDVLDSAARLRGGLGADFRDDVVESIYRDAAWISARSTSQDGERAAPTLDRALDRALTTGSGASR
jgi:ferrous iron transport protein B